MTLPTIDADLRNEIRFAAGKASVNNLTDDEIDEALEETEGEVSERSTIPWANETDYFETRKNIWTLLASARVLRGKNAQVDSRDSFLKEAERLFRWIQDNYTTVNTNEDITTVSAQFKSAPMNPQGDRILGMSRFTRRLGQRYRMGTGF